MVGRQPAQEVNILLSARGLQDVDVQAHHPHTDNAVVAVRIGAALVYFHDWASAATVARGWARCSRDAAWLPAQSRQPTTTQPVTEPVTAVSVIDVVGGAAVSVAGRLETIAGHPKRLFTSIGRLTIVVHDRAAYTSLRTAFATARERAAAVFPARPPELRTVAQEIAARAMGPARPAVGHGPTRQRPRRTRRRRRPPPRTAVASARPGSESVMTQPDYPLPVLPSYELYQVAHIATFLADRLGRHRGAVTKAERAAAVGELVAGRTALERALGATRPVMLPGADRCADLPHRPRAARGRPAMGEHRVPGRRRSAGVGGRRVRARRRPGRCPHRPTGRSPTPCAITC